MKTVSEYMRRRIYDQAGIDIPKAPGTIAEINLSIAEKHAELDQVVALAKNRLIMGTFRYGVNKQTHDRYDYGQEILRRYERYRNTGNTELLVDILNFAALEFNYPKHPNAHFHAEDDGDHTPEIK